MLRHVQDGQSGRQLGQSGRLSSLFFLCVPPSTTTLLIARRTAYVTRSTSAYALSTRDESPTLKYLRPIQQSLETSLLTSRRHPQTHGRLLETVCQLVGLHHLRNIESLILHHVCCYDGFELGFGKLDQGLPSNLHPWNDREFDKWQHTATSVETSMACNQRCDGCRSSLAVARCYRIPYT